jgi:hypothetical protein
MTAVVVTGSGSLARSICASLAVVADLPVAVTVLARSSAAAAEVAEIAAVRATLTGTPATFRYRPVELADVDDLAGALAEVAPAWVVHCASYQSPWERETAPSPWTRLLGAAGFGATAPLHAGLAATCATAIQRCGVHARLLNACFPDQVNPLLAARGLPVTAGVGNVALLAASLRRALQLAPTDPLRVLAHHVHLHEPADRADEALAWVGDTPVVDVTAALRAQRRVNRQRLNAVTGHAAALTLRDLVAGRDFQASLPGPAGLPGGYPVRIGPDATVALDLPPGWDPAAAVEWNARAGWREGLRIDGDRVRLNEPARTALEPWLPAYADGFSVAEVPEVCTALLRLRDRLRREPRASG